MKPRRVIRTSQLKRVPLPGRAVLEQTEQVAPIKFSFTEYGNGSRTQISLEIPLGHDEGDDWRALLYDLFGPATPPDEDDEDEEDWSGV